MFHVEHRTRSRHEVYESVRTLLRNGEAVAYFKGAALRRDGAVVNVGTPCSMVKPRRCLFSV